MAEEREARITVTEDGPYRVSGRPPVVPGRIQRSEYGESMDWETGEPIPTGKQFLLCRCGRSKTKPFCDDSHLEGFDGTETADRRPTAERRHAFEGGSLTLTDDRPLCAHAAFCERVDNNAWNMVRHGTDEERAEVEGIVARCPSGRLELWREGERVEPDYEPSVVVQRNGPYWVRGRIPVESADGTAWEVRNRVALCRCGQSRNKPFCDGTHREIGFRG
ncbi:MAG: CDGSH iron-sulfur domain-containing protein [Actinobacteria bacterium]|nr:CDGSH iron-sulfur domain-containing protein [Actinomycetota bacterium]